MALQASVGLAHVSVVSGVVARWLCPRELTGYGWGTPALFHTVSHCPAGPVWAFFHGSDLGLELAPCPSCPPLLYKVSHKPAQIQEVGKGC